MTRALTQTLFDGKEDVADMEARAALALLTQAANISKRNFTVQDGGADPLFALDTSALPNGLIATVVDLGGCGVNAAPGKGLVVWMGEWRRLSRGVTATMAAGSRTIDTFKDPMKYTFTGTSPGARVLIARSYVSALYSFSTPGVASALTTALSVNLVGSASNGDLGLLGPALNLVENVGTLARVDSV